MELKVAPQASGESFRSFHGVLLSLLISVSAELVLGGFSESKAPLLSSVARIVVVFLMLYTIHRFALTSLHSYKPRLKDLFTLAMVLIGSLFMVWLGKILALGLSQYVETSAFGFTIEPQVLHYAIPFASGALLLQSILGLHYGLVFSLSLSLVIGVYFPNQPLLVLFVLATSLMACLSLSRFRSRSAYLKAGFNIAIIGFPFALAAVILGGSYDVGDVAFPLLGALAGGILCSFVASGVNPVVEALGGYVTDMRLLEMATLDHPLLKELSIQAPGTWNHSMVMGMMVETAASAIGANSVLARVGAYFHDIGKMKKPLYFAENQGGGENRHDKLSTSMSALIIRSHVKDGIELGKKHKLPPPILDMIPQHHGTSVIEYFYDKAKKDAKEAGEDAPPVDRSLYSYPGPRPQTREAGILMLADGVEAAARTLGDPSPDRIQGMVQKMINKVFASGELNECELTLQDLHLIAKSFTRVLTSIYHQRVAYAEPAEKGVEKAPIEKPKASATQTNKESKEKPEVKIEPILKDPELQKAVAESEATVAEEDLAETDEKPKKGTPEDLKRLGI